MNAVDFKNYLFRCSSLGKLMTGVKEPLTDKQAETLIGLYEKQKSGNITDKQLITLGQLIEKRDAKSELSTTTKTYLKSLHREVFMKRSQSIQSKYLDKGIAVEEKSISLYTDVFGKLLIKNKIRFKNDFITGEPDNVQGIIRDFKSSWDFSTFPIYDNEIENDTYYNQLQGYMDLSNIDDSELIYCLIDTPYRIIEDELRRLDWKHGIMNIEGEIKEEAIPLVVEKVSGMIYTEEALIGFCDLNSFVRKEWFTDFFELPKEFRIKVFEVQRDKERMEVIKEQIIKSREYMNDLTLTISKCL